MTTATTEQDATLDEEDMVLVAMDDTHLEEKQHKHEEENHDHHDHKHNHHHHCHHHDHRDGNDHEHDEVEGHLDGVGHAHESCGCGDDHPSTGLLAYLPHAHGLGALQKRDRSALRMSLFIYVLWAIAESVAAVVANSHVLAVEALHVVLDALSVIFALISTQSTQERPRPYATFGYGRAEILAALVSIASLLGAMLWLLGTAIKRLIQPSGEVSGWILVVTSLIAVFVNVAVQCILGPSSKNGNVNLQAARAHAVADSVESFFAALVGLILWFQPNLTVVDPACTVIVVVFIFVINVPLLMSVLRILMEYAPDGLDMERLEADIRELEHVARVRRLHVWTVGIHQVLAAVKVDLFSQATATNETQKRIEDILKDAGAVECFVQISEDQHS